MVAKELVHAVMALPTADRLGLYERLGDSLRDHSAFDPISPEHARILDERLLDLENNPGDSSSWQEVDARLNQLLRGVRVGTGLEVLRSVAPTSLPGSSPP